MKIKCLLGHKWQGCACANCGETRDQDHDWEARHCRLHCRRCGMPGEFQHAWDGCRCRDCGSLRDDHHEWEKCVCKRCGHTRHQWLAGVCSLCGERCHHAETGYSIKILEGDHTAHAAKIKVCKRCGAVLK